MKKRVLLVGFLSICFLGTLQAQNKTLGVGVTTPNANAALHVESPTSNQGFIMPRLTTAQRNAAGFISILTATDNGLMVYDTDLKTLFIWDGTKWNTSAQVSGGPKLVYPYADTIGTAPNNSNLLRLIYAGSATENVGVAHFENLNTNNGFSAIFGRTNSATNGVADFIVNNPANNNDGLSSFTNGIGTAGRFTVNNASNQSAAIYATTDGTVGAQAYQSAAILGETSTAFSAVTGRVGAGQSNGVSGLSASTDPGSYAILGSNSGAGPAGVFNISNASNATTAFESSTVGTGGAGKFLVNNVSSTTPALWAETNSDQPLSAAIYGLNNGTGDVAASFRINNAANTFPALFAESNGTGRTATFRKLGTTGSQPAVFVQSMGGHGIWADHNSTSGYAAIFQTINTGNTNAGVLAESIGTGPSVWALKSTDAIGGNAFIAENQIATGSAASFDITDPTNTSATIFSNTDGTGAAIQGQTSTGFTAIYGRREGSSNGNAGLFEITNAANTYPALQANTVGTGSAANFQINNGSSSAPALFTQTNGTGSAIAANHTGSLGDVIYADRQGTGDGSAGNFRISNGSNNASAVYGQTNAAGGTAVGAMNSSGGVALAIWQGGMKVTTFDVTSTSIGTRAMAYNITSGGTNFTFSFGPSQGEVFLVYNGTGSAITVEGVAIPVGEGRTLVHFGAGGIKGF